MLESSEWSFFLGGLHWVFISAHRLSLVETCCLWPLWLLPRGLSCPLACGILVPVAGIEAVSPVLGGRFLTTGPPNEVFFWGGLSGNHCFERRSPRAFLCPGDLPLPYLIYVGGRKTKSQGERMWEKQSPGRQTTHCPGHWLSSASPLLRFWIFLDDITTTSIQSLNRKRDFPGGPAVKTVLPMQGGMGLISG